MPKRTRRRRTQAAEQSPSVQPNGSRLGGFRQGETLSFGLMASAFLGFFAWFLLQPSFFAQADVDAGRNLNRIADALLMPNLAMQSFQGFPGGFDRLPIALGAGLWLALAGWLGWSLVRGILPVVWLGEHRSSYSDRALAGCLSVLTGMAILSTLTLCVGLLGGLGRREPLLLGIAALAGIAWWMQRPKGRAAVVSATASGESPGTEPLPEQALVPDSVGAAWLLRLIPVMVVPLAIFYVLGAMVTPWEYDVLEYHLQAPKEFWSAGRIGFLEHNIYANMPLGAEMPSLAAMVLWGGESGWWYGALIGKSIVGVQGVLASILVGAFVARSFGSHLAWAGAGLVLAMPGNAHVSFAGLIDMVLAAYVLGALVCFQVGLEYDSVGNWRRLLVVGILSGAACACKYPGLLFAIVPAGIWMLWQVINSQLSLPKAAICFGLGLCLTCGPWLLKNWIQTGNPVFPLAYSVFGGRGLDEARMQRWSQVHSPQSESGLAPFRAGALLRDTKQVLVQSPWVNPSLNFLGLVALGGMAIAACGGGRLRMAIHPVWVLAVLWIFLVWWVATHRVDRFWLPAIPMLAILACQGASWIANRISTALAALILFLGVGFGCLEVFAGVGPLDCRVFVPLQDLERETLQETSYGAVNPTTAWVNRNLSEQDRLLCIGEVKAFLYRVPILYATCFDETPGEAWLRDRSPQEQLQALRENGITHVMVDWYEIERFRSPGNYGFGDWPQVEDFRAITEAGVLKAVPHPFPIDRVEIFEVSQE